MLKPKTIRVCPELWDALKKKHGKNLAEKIRQILKKLEHEK